VSIVPVDTLTDGTVDLQVQVQEVWSLRTDFSFSLASEGTSRWSIELSETNFLGHGVVAGLGFGETEDYSFFDGSFAQRRLLGSRWRLNLASGSRGDGYSDRIVVDRPFYALDDPWGLQLQAVRFQSDQRYYLSQAGEVGDGAADTGSLYGQFPVTVQTLAVDGRLRVSRPQASRIWRLGAGLQITDREYDISQPAYVLSDGRLADLRYLSEPGNPVHRDEGTLVYPFLILETRGRQWVKPKYLMQYGSVEDLDLGWSLRVDLGPTGPAVGSTTGSSNRFQTHFHFQDWSRLADGFLLTRTRGAVQLGNRDSRSTRLDLLLGWLTTRGGERYRRQFRLFFEWAWADRLIGTDAFVLGLNRGLRTLGFDGMAGDRLVRWNAEQGVLVPGEILGFYRIGLAGFYAGGMAWWHDEARTTGDLRQELGLGLRLGSVRSATAEIIRLDLTWDLAGDGSPTFTAVTGGPF
jgi:hypothetical protein